MDILVIGSGGREHALAWKISQSPKADKVYVAPGNAGTELEADLENVDIVADDINALLDFAKQQKIGLTVVGPEVPLVKGVVDLFSEAGLRCFGPSAGAAQLEGSKAFTKDFLARHHIATAAYGNFTVAEDAIAYIKEHGAPIVIKADGLAAGKGVILAQTEEEAIAAVKDMLAGNAFGNAGHRVVIEEFLVGEEASLIVMADGEHILAMASSQDHKARDNQDKGPNTGGMGAYSPAPVLTTEIQKKAIEDIIKPTIKGMAKEGYSFTGFLYAGLMVDEEGESKILEYNVRFGDPETQPVMMRLKSDLVELIEAALDKTLDKVSVEWDERTALGVVLAAGGYPDSYAKNEVISGLSHSKQDAKIFHAGTVMQGDDVITSGGRVLCAVALGKNVTEAQKKAYELTHSISWKDVYYRDDIGYRAVDREKI